MNYIRKIAAVILIVAMISMMVTVSASITGTSTGTVANGWNWQSVLSDSGVYVDNSTAAGGENSLKIYNNTPREKESYVWVTYPVDVKKGRQYSLSFDAKADNANTAWMAFDWTKTSMTPTARTYDWMQFEMSYTATADATLNLRFGADDKTDGLWLDNVSFYDVENQEVNLVKCGDFEGLKTEAPKNTEETTVADPGSFNVYRKTIEVDGKLDDWGETEVHEITRRQEFAENIGQIITGNIRFSYDDENLYIGIESIDEIHHPDYNKYWNGDGAQFAIATVGSVGNALTERGMALYDQMDKIHQTSTDFNAAIVREGNKNVYEASIPWKNQFGGSVPGEILFNAVINNSDGEGRKYCLEITPGISNGKNAALFKKLILWQPFGSVLYMVDSPSNIEIGSEKNISASFINPGTTSVTAEMCIEEIGKSQSVTIAPGEEKKVEIPVSVDKGGDRSFEIKLKCGESEISFSKIITGLHNADSYIEMRERLGNYIIELKELILECENRGMHPDYEIANYSIICKFKDYLHEEAEHGDYSRMHIYDANLTEAYEEAKTNLKAFLAGEKKPMDVPKYVTGSVEFDEKLAYADTLSNGVRERRPVFFTGYGCWDTVAEEIPFFQTIGVNFIQTEITMEEVFVEDDVEVWGLRNVGRADVKFGVSDAEKKSGNYSMHIQKEQPFSSNKYEYLVQEFEVKPNTTYVYGLSSKGTVGHARGLYLNMDGLEMKNRKYVQSSGEWIDYEYEYTTSAEQKRIRFVILAEYPMDVYIDDVFVKEKGSDVNLIKNGDFETIKEKTKYDKEAEELGFYINDEQLNYLRETLLKAEQNNILVDVGVCPHYMPKFILEKDPMSTAAGSHFTPFSLDNSLVRKMSGLYARVLSSVLSEYDSVHTVCLMNEPGVFSNQFGDYYVPGWIEFLKERHGNIEVLNERYGSDYKSFEEVAMPMGASTFFAEPTPLYYDYRSFNDTILPAYVKYLADEIKSEFPEFSLHTKIMDYFRFDYQRYLIEGTNWEELSESLDLNGCDAHSYYENANTPMWAKMAWHDFMTSVKDAPVWDTESHIIDDAKVILYDHLRDDYMAADYWIGAIHGRGGIATWIWERHESCMPWGSRNNQNSNFTMRPGAVAKTAKTSLDLQRLALEIEAIVKKDAKTAVIYSRTSQGYNPNYVKAFIKAHADLMYSGQKVDFIMDTKFETINNYDLVVIAESTNVSKEMLAAIKAYIENGGTVLITDDSSLKMDEYNNPHNSDIVNYIYANSETEKSVKEKVKEMKLSEIVLVDAQTGDAIDGVEWAYVEYNGNMLVNIINYDRVNTVNAKILYNGNVVLEFKELRSGEMMKAAIVLAPYKPVLLEFAK